MSRGTALLSVILMMNLIFIVTVAVMGIVQADLAAGVRQQHAVQVFNVAEAGVHYALARLQQPGAATYRGEAIDIRDRVAGLIGRVTLIVECLDDSSPAVNSCAGAHAAYRRIRSTGRLPVPGPARLLTVVVEGAASATGSFALCGYDGVNLDEGVQVYGDVGSNANLALAREATPTRICDSVEGATCPAPPSPPARGYSGSAYAVGTITCDGGACNSTQIEGTIGPNQPTRSVCPLVTLTPPSSPGRSPLTVPAGITYTIDPTIMYGDVTLASSGENSACPADVNQRATLVIDSGTDPNGTVTVAMGRLWVGGCARVVITGSGRVVLWVLEPATVPADAARQALKAEKMSIFGSTTTGHRAAPIAGGRFIVNIVSSKPLGGGAGCLDGAATCAAVHFDRSALISGTFVIPYGGVEIDQAQLANGAMLARRIQFNRNTIFTWDPRSNGAGSTSYTNFDRLKSWKDQ